MMETHQFGGPWTVEKLDALRAYLIGYAQALKNQPFLRYYPKQSSVDPFPNGSEATLDGTARAERPAGAVSPVMIS
jgi:hypothetical protein